MVRNLALVGAVALACSPRADGFSFGRGASSTARRSASKPLKSVPMVEYQQVTELEPALEAWGVGPAPIDDFGAAVQHVSPPLLRIPSFLTPAECEMIKKATVLMYGGVDDAVRFASVGPPSLQGASPWQRIEFEADEALVAPQRHGARHAWRNTVT